MSCYNRILNYSFNAEQFRFAFSYSLPQVEFFLFKNNKEFCFLKLLGSKKHQKKNYKLKKLFF